MRLNRFRGTVRLCVPLCLLLSCLGGSFETTASSGELIVRWTPPPATSAIEGYRVYFSPSSGDYDNMPFVEIPDPAIAGVRVFGLDDCADSHFVVRSYGGSLESANSAEVRSWPRPRFTSISLPNTIEPGQNVQFDLAGSNFEPGDTCEIAGMNCSLAVIDCRTAALHVSAPAGIDPGPYRLTVRHQSGVEGVLGGAIQVLDPSLSPDDPDYLVDDSPPVILYGAPSHRSTLVVPTARVLLRFSESVLVEQAVIELEEVPIVVRLVGDRAIEIVPQAPLEYGRTYTLTLSGIKDPSGNVQTTMTHLFTVEPDPATTTLGTPEATFSGATADDVVWSPADGAQYYEVWRCVGASCWLAQHTETRFPSVFDRWQALDATHHVGLDGEFLPAGETVPEFVNSGLEYTYKIRACKSVDGLEICGEFSNELGYTGRQFMCVEAGAEIPCYPGAPLIGR